MAVEWKKLAYEDNVITKAFLTAKGQLISASAASTPGVLTVGTNDYVLIADSGETLGLKWGSTGAGDMLKSVYDSNDDGVLADAEIADDITLTNITQITNRALDDLQNPDAAVGFNGQQATDLVLEKLASPPVTPVVGKIYLDTDDTKAYICTSDA